MYNRYIPQPDGSYRRKWIEDAPSPTRPAMPPAEKQVQKTPSKVEEPPCPPAVHPIESQAPCAKQCGAGFLQQLLPRNFDVGDLIVIALLLLIAGDCEAERSNALLTLALYFSM